MTHPLDPPKPCLSDSAWDLLADFPLDAEEMLRAFNGGFDVIIDPMLGLVATCALASLTKEIARRFDYIVIEADSGLVLHY